MSGLRSYRASDLQVARLLLDLLDIHTRWRLHAQAEQR